jgi:hypothetical protein
LIIKAGQQVVVLPYVDVERSAYRMLELEERRAFGDAFQVFGNSFVHESLGLVGPVHVVSLGRLQGERFSILTIVEGSRTPLLPAFCVYVRADSAYLVLDASAVHILQLGTKT